MRMQMILRHAIPFALAGVWIHLSGCSAFQGSRALEMTPFAENTAAMFGEAKKINRPFQFFYLKQFRDIPESRVLRELAQPTLRALDGIVMYSNQIVALNMSTKTEKEKNLELAKYLQEATKKVAERGKLAELGIDPASLDTVFLKIRAAETFLGGLTEASPMVNAFVLAILDRLEQISDEVPAVEAGFIREIENQYGDKRRNYDSLVKLQTMQMREVGLVYECRYGDRSALNTLLADDPSLKEFVRTPAVVNLHELDTFEKVLNDRLANLDGLLRQMEVQRQQYIAMYKELADWRAEVDEKIMIARDAMMVWGQSHRNLAAGIAVPPLIDVGGVAAGLAKKVAPLP